jgi:hypothetical protein
MAVKSFITLAPVPVARFKPSFIGLRVDCSTTVLPGHRGGKYKPGNTKGGSITVLLTTCLTGLESAV